MGKELYSATYIHLVKFPNSHNKGQCPNSFPLFSLHFFHTKMKLIHRFLELFACCSSSRPTIIFFLPLLSRKLSSGQLKIAQTMPTCTVQASDTCVLLHCLIVCISFFFLHFQFTTLKTGTKYWLSKGKLVSSLSEPRGKKMYSLAPQSGNP